MSLVSNIQAVLTRIAGEFNTIKGKLIPAGGTTGQVLTKNSGTDHDTVWADPSVPSHDHSISDVVGLQTALDGKQKTITQSSTQPSNPSVGDLWIEI